MSICGACANNVDGCRHVSNALRALMKGVQANGEVDEDELDDVVRSLLPLPPSSWIQHCLV